MKVSVVIPTYNAAAFVVEAVLSVLAQTCPPHEIIVVDDGSTDDTAGRLKGLPITVIHQANAGVAMARNAGVAAATGDAIAFLDADDVWHPRKLELQVPLFECDNCDLTATGCFPWPGDVPEISDDCIIDLQRIELKDLVVRNSIVTSTVLVKRELVEDFDKRMQGPEDYDLWLRIAQKAPCAFLPAELTGYRTVAGSLSKNAERMEAGMRLILAKLEAAGVFAGKPLLRRKAWGYFHYSCGYMHRQAGHRAEAKKHLLASLVKYPWFYSREDVRYLFGRLRLFLST